MKKFGMLWLFAGVFVCVIIALMFLRKHQPPASSKMSSAAVARANGLTEKAGRSSKRYSDMIDNPNAMMGTFESYSPSGVLTYSYGSEGQGTGKGTLLVGPSTKITLHGDPAQVTDLKREMNICFLQKESGTIIGQIDAFTMLPDGKLHTLQGPADTVESDTHGGGHPAFDALRMAHHDVRGRRGVRANKLRWGGEIGRMGDAAFEL